MTWDVYAFRYGCQPDLPAERTTVFPQRLPAGSPPEPFCYCFWLARSDAATVLVDCGFSAAQAASRGRTLLASPVDMLAEIGVNPEDIDHLILTHLHYDHAGNIANFPRAVLHVHLEEWVWATGLGMADPQLAEYYDATAIGGLVPRLYSGDLRFVSSQTADIAGLKVEHLGGHSPGQMIVHIPAAGGDVVLASDAAHLAVNVENQNPFPIVHDLQQAQTGLAHLAALQKSGSRVISGHDPKVFDLGTPIGQSGNIVSLHKALAHV